MPAPTLTTVMTYVMTIAFTQPQSLGYFVFQVMPLKKWVKHNGGFKGHSNPRHPRLKPSYLKVLVEKADADLGGERWLDSRVICFGTAVNALYKKNRLICLKLIARNMAKKSVSLA